MTPMSICFCKSKKINVYNLHLHLNIPYMKKYIVIFISALLLVGITFYSLYNVDNDTKQSITSGDKFYKILFLKDDKPPLEEIDSNWKYLKDFEQAFDYVSHSAPIDAISVYSSLANNKEIPDILREFAQYLEIMNSFYLDSEKLDDNKIENLMLNSVYPYSSQEAIALVKISNNDIKGATKILHSLLNDKKCPTLIKANAQELLKIYY